MTQSHTTRSPLAGLVLFMVCLSIAGTFIAGIHYVIVDRPAQIAAARTPINGNNYQVTQNCIDYGNWWNAFWGVVFGDGTCTQSNTYVCCRNYAVR
jgi:hypothetical protein